MAEGKEHLATGICAVAAATLCSKGASEAERQLATKVSEAAIGAVADRPRESESIAGCWNRHMDVLIDGADDCRGSETRWERRAAMSRALDRAGLIVLDKSYLAELLAPRIRGLEDPEGKWTNVDGQDFMDAPGRLTVPAPGSRIWRDQDGNLFTGENGTIPLPQMSDVDGHDLGEELLEQEERDHNGGYTLAEEAAAEADEAVLHGGDYARPETND